MREGSGSAAVALSFDDGPDPEVTVPLLDILAELDVRATFFPISSRAREHPTIIARMLAEGHAVGLHGAFHLKHSIYPDDVLAADTRLAIEWLGNDDVRLWRPPHGTATEMTRRLAAEYDLVLQGWSLSSADWIDGHTSEAMFERLAPHLKAGAVIDMHDAIGPGKRGSSPSLRSSCQPTLELVPRLVAEARARGLSLDAIVAPATSRGANRTRRSELKLDGGGNPIAVSREDDAAPLRDRLADLEATHALVHADWQAVADDIDRAYASSSWRIGHGLTSAAHRLMRKPTFGTSALGNARARLAHLLQHPPAG